MKRRNPYPVDNIMQSNLHSFGMLMKEGTFSSGDYRFGFNGKAKTDEINGDGAVYDYGYRIYEVRLGRFLSVDPISKKFPMLTPYQYASNTPIWAIDIDGLEGGVLSTDPMWYIEEASLEYWTAVCNIFTVSAYKSDIITNSTAVSTTNSNNQTTTVSNDVTLTLTTTYSVDLGGWMQNRDPSAPLVKVDQSFTTTSSQQGKTESPNNTSKTATASTSATVSTDPNKSNTSSTVSAGMKNKAVTTTLSVTTSQTAAGGSSTSAQASQSVTVPVTNSTESLSAKGSVGFTVAKPSTDPVVVFSAQLSANLTYTFPNGTKSTETKKGTKLNTSTTTTKSQTSSVQVGVSVGAKVKF